MIGGTSDAALRRAARIGDMWQAFGLTPEKFHTRLDRLRSLASGRPVTAGAVVSAAGSARDASTLVSCAQDWAAAGAEHLAIHFGELIDIDERMTRFVRHYSQAVDRNRPRGNA
jgi:alkanesulfonate monooxygenase SsuD/methylene tetrahydromethanopterin reductase-like flavin-dependent oxidoreductase (luciferase family)